jgi:hypothetical protein
MAISQRKLVTSQGHNLTSFTTLNRTYSAGGGAGQTVSVDMTSFYQDNYGNGLLPTLGRYCVNVSPSTPAIPSISNKGNSGFTITLSPISPTATISAGVFDCVVMS